MNWFYESAGAQQGPVSEADLDRLLAEGRITQDTLVWREGMAGWMPHRAARPAPASVGSDLDYEVTRPGTPMAQSPQAAAPMPPTSPISPISGIPNIGAGVNPTGGSDVPQPGWIRCSYTGRYFPPSDIIYIEGRPYSAAAKPQVLASLTSGQALPDMGGDRNGPPWEHREQLGLWKALVETVKQVLTKPKECFATMRREGGLGSPLLFYAITAGVCGAVAQVYGLALNGAMMGLASQSGSGTPNPFGAMGFAAIGAGSIILVPIMSVLFLFIQAGVIHLMLMALKAANYPFETTFRVLAYAVGAAGVLQLIPGCGGSIGGIWGLVAACIGLGPAQNTTTGKGVAAVLTPIVVCCIGVLGIWAAVIGVAAAASGAGR